MNIIQKTGLPKNTFWTIFAFGVMCFFWGPADAYFAIYLKSFSDSYTMVGFLSSLAKLIPLFIAVPIGIYADRSPAQRIALYGVIGMLIYTLGYYLAGITGSLALLSATLLFNGIANIVRNVGMETYIKETVSGGKAASAFSYLGVMNALWGAGFLLGAVLIAFVDITLFFIIALIGVIFMTVVYARLPNARDGFHVRYPILDKQPMLKRLKRGWMNLRKMDARALHMFWLSFVCAMTVGVIDMFVALFIDDLGLSLALVGVVGGGSYIALLCAPQITAYSKKSIGVFAAMAIGLLVMIFTMAIFYFFAAQSIYILIACVAVHHLFFWSLVKSVRNGVLTTFTPKDMQGEVTGIQMTLLTLANLLGALLFGVIGDIWGLAFIFVVMIALYVCMFVGVSYLHVVYHKRTSHHSIPNIHSLAMVHWDHLGGALVKDFGKLEKDITKDVRHMGKDVKKEFHTKK